MAKRSPSMERTRDLMESTRIQSKIASATLSWNPRGTWRLKKIIRSPLPTPSRKMMSLYPSCRSSFIWTCLIRCPWSTLLTSRLWLLHRGWIFSNSYKSVNATNSSQFNRPNSKRVKKPFKWNSPSKDSVSANSALAVSLETLPDVWMDGLHPTEKSVTVIWRYSMTSSRSSSTISRWSSFASSGLLI